MILALEEFAVDARVLLRERARREAQLARTLARLGFLPSLASPRFDAPAPAMPTRRRDDVAADWKPV